MRKERLSAIEEYINANGFVTMDRICEQFGIALPTVRKDIAEACKRGTDRKGIRRCQAYRQRQKKYAYV